MVIVDTSAWIEYLGDGVPAIANKVDLCLDRDLVGIGDLIYCEVMQGIRSSRERREVSGLLLSLPPYIQEDLLEQRLSMGHARVLAGLKTPREQKALRDLMLKKGLTVRQAEETARRLSSSGPSRPPSEESETLSALADNLKRSLGTKVDIQKRGRRGRITIHFYSDEELERLLDLLG